MKQIGFAIVCLALGGCLHQLGSGVQGSGKKATEERKVEAFTAVEVDGPMDVAIGVGNAQGVTVEGDDNIVELITMTVRNGTLIIDTESNYTSKMGLKVRISVPKLERAVLNGSGKILADGVGGQSFFAQVAGSGAITVKGSVSKVEALITGSGSLELRQLPCDNAKASITGSGSIEIAPVEQLNAIVTGSGQITYYGEPNVVKEVTGSGQVVQGKA